MKCTALPVGDGAVDRLGEHGVVEQRAVLDRQVDARELLVDDAAGADVEVPDLGVAHLPLGQPDGEPGARERRPRAAREQPVEVGRVARASRRCPAGGSARPKPSMMTRSTRAGCSHAHGVVARRATMSANESASSAAPPTSAPSMSGSAKNMRAFSGLTEPP